LRSQIIEAGQTSGWHSFEQSLLKAYQQDQITEETAKHLGIADRADPRTNLLDVQVRIVGNRVFLTGSVESALVRAAAEVVVREAVPADMEVVNNIWLQTYVP